MNKDEYDFGYTVEVVPEIKQDDSEQLRNKLEMLVNDISTFLNNLKREPEKEYIHWPNRIESIDKFLDKIAKLY